MCIYGPEHIFETRPDYLVILAWNLKDEVMKQMSAIREWGGKSSSWCPKSRSSTDRACARTARHAPIRTVAVAVPGPGGWRRLVLPYQATGYRP